MMRSASLGAVREFIGEAGEGVTRMITQVESVGGFDTFVRNHKVYSAMIDPHLRIAREAYHSPEMRAAFRVIRIVLDDVIEEDEPEAVPWRDKSVV
jgi:hypothetical protein